MALGLNAIVLQVRSGADAVYPRPGTLGATLTGTQGIGSWLRSVAFAVTEAHARGLELHAWINPFRAGNSSDSTKLALTTC